MSVAAFPMCHLLIIGHVDELGLVVAPYMRHRRHEAVGLPLCVVVTRVPLRTTVPGPPIPVMAAGPSLRATAAVPPLRAMAMAPAR